MSPGEIDIFDPGHLDDPYPALARLRARRPVYTVPGTDFHLVTSWELVTEAAARTADFSSHLTGLLVQQPGGPPATFDMDGGGQAVHVLATADDPAHAAHRKLVLPLLSRRLRTLGPVVERLVERLWDEELRDDRLEWATGMADRLPLALVADLIGLPGAAVPQLLTWAYDSTEMLGGVVSAERLPRLVGSAAALAAYLADQLAAAKKTVVRENSTLLPILAGACADGALADDVAVLMLVQLIGAGGESTAGLIANAACVLATDAGLQRRVRAHPELLPGLLEETLRWESPFRGHHRHVRADTRLGGVELAAGSHLLLLWGAANRDPSVFADPDVFQLERPQVRRHLAFGKGAHFCVGSALAKLEATAALTALLRRSAWIELAGPAQWVPSIFVRRHARLPLRIHR
ncbi:cytochrome P450 [Nocardia sp. NPDC048505]|uniref:cytochrome P450 n=1 Tax=unclassified Nocardia TaxID=2637762 RepID=UPI0033E39184